MTGLNEFKEWVAMERKSIEHTLPFWAGDFKTVTELLKKLGINYTTK